MDQLSQIFNDALRRSIAEAGSQTNLSKISGVPQNRISEYLSGGFEFKNMTVGTLIKLFPEIKEDIEIKLSASAEKQQEGIQTPDEATRLLMRFWANLSLKRQLEILAQLAAEQELTEEK